MDSLAQLSADAAQKFKKFKIKRDPENCALILVIKGTTIEVEAEFDKKPLEELQEELPEVEPRFVVYSYKYPRSDGRVTYPLVLIYYSPTGINPRESMIYTSSLGLLQTALPGVQRSYTVKDVEQINDEWMLEQLKKF
ncbi:Glia maturation factor beta, putative [Entamoeba invadens IP1]|uniref:Glia maturation factor beta, putative n=1 Tax=Entamoeba invadens IP1 TaxID=370355 RepID=UPI0002C3F5BE|nr:Glia maturation factor beta, putative [Entamoeba invadens IP1]ELP90563.1 Glia maturation factor beta, putative [Entamoeba invadens IP1]|eukprot:XP_004257334.1 Glia maturation factor beta, putative [Entamoeba invadens IP1]